MLKVSIIQKADQRVSNQATFATQAEVDAWIVECESVSAFGYLGNEEYTNEMDEVVPAREKEYDIQIEDISAQVSQEQVNADALAYLASTDWMAIREAEGGTAMPEEVKLERQAARSRVVR